MKNLAYIDRLVSTDRDAWIAEYRAANDCEKAFCEVYSATCTKTPMDTVRELIARIGYDWAAAIIATVVHDSAWDGRISKRAAEWAKTVEGAYDEDANKECLHIYAGNVHRAHLDQIALEFMRWAKPTDNDLASFVANVRIHDGEDEEMPWGIDDCITQINNWGHDGVEMPVGITPETLREEYNRQLAANVKAITPEEFLAMIPDAE